MNSFEEAAAKKREDVIFDDSMGHVWHGVLLQPWNHNREALCDALLREDAPAPDLRELDFIQESFASLRERLLADEDVSAEERARIEGMTLGDMVEESGGFSFSPYFPVAAKILWLLHHEPKDWRHLRGPDLSEWLAVIEEWAGNPENIGPGELEQAVWLAHRIRTAHRCLVTVPRPSSFSSKAKPGN